MEYVGIYLEKKKKKNSVEYARIILNVPDAVRSIKSSTIY